MFSAEDLMRMRSGAPVEKKEAPKVSSASSEKPEKEDAVSIVEKEASFHDASSAESERQKPSADIPMDAGITYRRNPKEVPERPAAKVKHKGERKAVMIKNVPASLVDMCKRSVQDSSAPNNKTLCAFLYAFRDKSFDGIIDYSDVPDDVVAFSKSFDLAKEKAEFDKRVSSIERQVRTISSAQMQSLWALIYLVWNAAGLRNDHPRSPDEIGFSQSQEGFRITLEVLEKAVGKYLDYEKQKEGRPIR